MLKTQIAHQIINDYRSAISSLNSGAPFMANKPDSALSRAVMELARLVDQQATSSAELRELEFAGAY